MAQIDRAIEQLASLFEKWEWEEHRHMCEELLIQADEARVQCWLYRTLKQFEASPVLRWSARESGVLLHAAGLIHPDEVESGAEALRNVADPEEAMAEAPS